MKPRFSHLEFKRIVVFGLIGVFNTSVDYVIFFVSLQWISANLVLAQCLGYSSGMMVSFMLNKNITFKQKGTPFIGEFLKFIVVNLFTLWVTSELILKLTTNLEWEIIAAKGATTFVSLGLNYMASRFWVFRRAWKGVSEDENHS